MLAPQHSYKPCLLSQSVISDHESEVIKAVLYVPLPADHQLLSLPELLIQQCCLRTQLINRGTTACIILVTDSLLENLHKS